MEKLLGLYAQPYHPKRPLWCFDERPCQLIGDTLVPLPPNQVSPNARIISMSVMASVPVLLAVQPHTGLTFVQLREQRTALDYAEFMAALVAAHCQRVARLYSSKTISILIHRLPFTKLLNHGCAYELMQRLRMHYTPKKASWLNMAEIQLSVLARQCLNRRIPSFLDFAHHVHAWARQRNLSPVPIRWQFTPAIARSKFQRFYPNLAKLSTQSTSAANI
ncbi:MAG: transposase [Caldilineaceae bacterium]